MDVSTVKEVKLVHGILLDKSLNGEVEVKGDVSSEKSENSGSGEEVSEVNFSLVEEDIFSSNVDTDVEIPIEKVDFSVGEEEEIKSVISFPVDENNWLTDEDELSISVISVPLDEIEWKVVSKEERGDECISWEKVECVEGGEDTISQSEITS